MSTQKANRYGSPFRDIGIGWEATFQLGIDDAPGSVNLLVVRVETISDDETRAFLTIGTRSKAANPEAMDVLASEPIPVQALQNLLFGAARVVTKFSLENMP